MQRFSTLPTWIADATLAVAMVTALASCAVEDQPNLGESADEIIGGVPLTSPRFNGVVSIFEENEAGDGGRGCTGTLVTPTLVITAKHCVTDPPLVVERTRIEIGFNAVRPERRVPVRGVAVESTVATGGALGNGIDVAVLHLAEPVTDVPRFTYAPFDPNTVGERYMRVGYGVQNNDEVSNTRFAGAVTLQGTSGSPLRITFGTFQEFLRQVPTLLDFKDQSEAELRDAFENSRLLADHEAVLGNAPGDAQTCFGDSGGPLFQKRGGTPVLVGVGSAVLAGSDLICKFGGVEAVFGPAAIRFLDREAACPLLPAGGACDGNVAVTCSESGRTFKQQRTDCTAKGKVCAIDGAGAAACIKRP